MVTLNKLAQRLNKGLQDRIEGIRAEIGRLESDGTYTVRVAGRNDEVYVRLEGDPARTVTAINQKTDYRARLPVRVRLNRSGRYEVIDVEPIQGQTFLGEAVGTGNIPPLIGDELKLILPGEKFKPGRVRPFTGTDLQVYMERFPYGTSELGNVSMDLATVVGTIASDKKAWIIVSVNPQTNALTATKGSDVGLPVSLTRANALAVTIPTGDIRAWGYIIKNGDTTLPTVPLSADGMFEADLRTFIQPGLIVQEIDGAPAVEFVQKIKVTNGSLTDNGDGSVSLSTSGGGTVTAVTASSPLASSGGTTPNISLGAITDKLIFTEWSESGTPSANDLWVYAADDNGYTVQRLIDSGAVIFQQGRDIYVVCKNTTGGTVAAGKPVSFLSALSGTPLFQLADADAPLFFDGITRDSSIDNAYTRVQIAGVVLMDTTGFSAGDTLYLSKTTGSITATPPTYPCRLQQIGIALDSTASGHVLLAPHLYGEYIWADTINIGLSSSNPIALVGYVNGKTGTLQWGTTFSANRTWTWPNASGEIVLDGATQTLTNKSIDGSEINSGAVAAANGGTGQTSYAAKGDILASSGTTTLSKLAVGANKKVLTADSAQSTGLAWDDAALTVLSANNILTGNAASFDLTSISGSYKHLKLLLKLRSDKAGATQENIYIRLNNDSTASHYYSYGMNENSATPAWATTQRLGATGTAIEVRLGCTAANATAGYFTYLEVTILNYAVTNTPRQIFWNGSTQLANTDGNLINLRGNGLWTDVTTAINQITILPVSAGNFVADSSCELLAVA